MKAAVDLQIFLTFLISFVLRALQATPSASFGLGLASFEPQFVQTPHGGPAVFYGWVLVGSLVAVLALAVALTASQLWKRHRWLNSTMQ
eukprot:SAG31_NODE_18950_length_616_cov_6.752418_1_plen_88_part_10